jgi:3',5'-nucleoside bisphosphate phosphatase
MRIDLHTHSDRSDGTESPSVLVHRAAAEGIDVLAITDHDTTESWPEAAAAAEATGLTLVRGIEVSCRFAGYGVHLLAYLPDDTYPPLRWELQRILDGRNSRLPATLERLRAIGIEIDVDDVRRVAGNTAAMGRPHVADALVDLGIVSTRTHAFDTYLGPRGPAYVNRYAAELVTMIRTITDAGGVSVIAHPWASRHNHSALDAAGLEALQDAGLVGIEVDHEDHDAETREALRGIAKELDLVVTGSSDHHGAGKRDHELGCNVTAPDELERLLDLAARSSQASGRRTPEVLNAR